MALVPPQEQRSTPLLGLRRDTRCRERFSRVHRYQGDFEMISMVCLTKQLLAGLLAIINIVTRCVATLHITIVGLVAHDFVIVVMVFFGQLDHRQ
mmetsp:Transcript_41279/g.54262  ORF Transcript_41279/g.54262 Transcript_41279/m.54262 type:complete len:95 (+) Transcript_41279:503-787(+)